VVFLTTEEIEEQLSRMKAYISELLEFYRDNMEKGVKRSDIQPSLDGIKESISKIESEMAQGRGIIKE